jgi:hypothetical protein
MPTGPDALEVVATALNLWDPRGSTGFADVLATAGLVLANV